MDEFWVVREGLRLGPFDESEVLRSYESGALHADDVLVAADGGPGATIGEVFGELRRDILTSPDLMLEPLDGSAGAGTATARVAPSAGADSTFDAPSWTHEDLGGPAYAGFWVRLGALALDLAIMTVLSVAVLLGLVFGAGFDPEAHQLAITAFSVVIGLAYFALQESGPRCATWGKRAFHLQVLAARDRTRIGLLRACARWIGRCISSLFLLGYLIQPFTSRRQALHDLIAGTIVVVGAQY